MLQSLQSIPVAAQGACVASKELTPKPPESTSPETTSVNRPVRGSLTASTGAIAVMVALALPICGYLVHGESLGAQESRELIFWALTLLLVAYVLLVERRLISS